MQASTACFNRCGETGFPIQSAAPRLIASTYESMSVLFEAPGSESGRPRLAAVLERCVLRNASHFARRSRGQSAHSREAAWPRHKTRMSAPHDQNAATHPHRSPGLMYSDRQTVSCARDFDFHWRRQLPSLKKHIAPRDRVNCQQAPVALLCHLLFSIYGPVTAGTVDPPSGPYIVAATSDCQVYIGSKSRKFKS
jgi:hypothetical protein